MSKSDPQYAMHDRFLDQPYSLSGRLIDPVSGTLSWQGKREHLRRKELEVLALLASAEGKQVTRENFIAVVWQGNDLVGDRGLTNTVVFLRRSLRDEDADQPLIRTIPRRGYQLAVSVQQPLERTTERVENVIGPGGMIPECPGWRLLRRLSESPVSDLWLAEPSQFGEREQKPRVFRFCRSEAYLRRLQREVTLLRYVNQSLAEHPGFAVIRDWQLDEPPYYLARDYAKYGSLSEWTQASGMPQSPPLRVMAELSEALAALHQLGVVHRNLSADRILVDETDAGPQFKISALGLGALTDREKLAPLQITALGLTMGAEEAGAQASPADDVAALGLVFLQLAVGDWQAEPDANGLSKVADAGLQALLRRCVGSASERPSAAELAQQLRALLAPGAPGDAKETPAALPMEPTPLPNAPQVQIAPVPDTPHSIGPYRILETLGVGGMGSVYLAEQREPVQRTVAVKVIKTGMDSTQVLARFEAERQALALMNHLNVAAVFDANTTRLGQPYFAMEYVPGLEITAHCDKYELDLHTRVTLFLQVCDGVMHAHQKGLIHRDLKPSNILVKRLQDQPSTVKIIDFGVAKSLHGKLGEHTAHTRIGSFVGTPVYSSPEQILGHQSGIDTRSDIYSMGVVLYELLSGVTPYSDKELSDKSQAELAKLLSQSDPPALAPRFASLDPENEAAIAKQRSTSVERMLQSLGADVSWIVAKCLERDPEDRYASALELKTDLQRWLENRPVNARPATRWYRLRKYVKRNRLLVSAAAVIAFALIGTTTAAVVGFVRAERALAEAELAAEFQVKQMKAIDPAAMGLRLRASMKGAMMQSGVQAGLDAPAMQGREREINLLMQGVNFTDISSTQLDENYFKPTLAAINNGFADNPLLQAKLMQGLAEIQLGMGRFQDALNNVEQALAQRRKLLGAHDLATLVSLRVSAKARGLLGQLDSAEADLRDAMTATQLYFGPEHSETLNASNDLAEFLLNSQKTADAVALLQQSVAFRRKTLGSDDPHTLESITQLSYALMLTGDLEQATILGKEAFEVSRRAFGAVHPESMRAANGYGVILVGGKRFDEAAPIFDEVASFTRETLGNQHPNTLVSINNLAGVYFNASQFDEAETLLREIIAIRSEVFGADHIDTQRPLVNLGVLLVKQGRLQEAESCFQRASLVFLRAFGEVNRQTLSVNISMAETLAEMEKFDDAIALFRTVLLGRQTTFGAEHKFTLESAKDLMAALRRAGQLAEAETLATQTLATHRRIGTAQAEVLTTLHEFALILHAKGQSAEAETQLREVLAAQRALISEDKLPIFRTISSLVQVLRDNGKLDEALALGDELLAAPDRVRNFRKQYGLFQLNHAHTLAKLEKNVDAEALYLAAYANLTHWSSEAHKPLRELASGLLDLYQAWEKSKTRPIEGLAAKIAAWRKRLAEFG